MGVKIYSKTWLYVAAYAMVFVGITRGVKAILLFLSPNKKMFITEVSKELHYQSIALLIFSSAVFLAGAYMLLKYHSIQGWLLGWVGIIFLFLGVVLNSMVLDIVPSERLLALNLATAVVIIIGLILGRKSVKDE